MTRDLPQKCNDGSNPEVQIINPLSDYPGHQWIPQSVYKVGLSFSISFQLIANFRDDIFSEKDVFLTTKFQDRI